MPTVLETVLSESGQTTVSASPGLAVPALSKAIAPSRTGFVEKGAMHLPRKKNMATAVARGRKKELQCSESRQKSTYRGSLS
jgi:hypothetical protein